MDSFFTNDVDKNKFLEKDYSKNKPESPKLTIYTNLKMIAAFNNHSTPTAQTIM